VEEGEKVPPLLLDLVEHRELLPLIEAVNDRALLGVAHGIDLDRPALVTGDHTARLIGETVSRVRDDLLVERSGKLEHHLDTIVPRALFQA
jgi:hypothetical protein